MIGLTQQDENDLVRMYRNAEKPLERVGIMSHYRFFRLLQHGMVATIPPRLTEKGMRRAVAVEKSQAEVPPEPTEANKEGAGRILKEVPDCGHVGLKPEPKVTMVELHAAFEDAIGNCYGPELRDGIRAIVKALGAEGRVEG